MSDDHSHQEGLDRTEAPIDPAFDAGVHVKVLNSQSDRYKRRPEYAENAVGTIESIRGAYEPPESPEANPTEEVYEYLYTVRFSHSDIWGDDHPESNGSVSIDIWESTLKKVV